LGLGYNGSMHVNDRIEEVKSLITDIGKDAEKLLSMVQMTIPVAEGVVKRVLDRVDQAKKLFTTEEVNGRNA
jgi:hypothetical protein